MTMTIPTVPSMPAGYVATVADMQNLAYAATFLLTKPIAMVLDTSGGQAIGTSNTAVQFSSAYFDTDGMWSGGAPTRLTVQTPGWYRVRYGVNCGTAGGVYNSAVQSVTGPNNPSGSGITSQSYWGGYADTNASSIAGCASGVGIWPFYLYTGDFLKVVIQAAATGSTTGITAPSGFAPGGSWFSAEYVSIR